MTEPPKTGPSKAAQNNIDRAFVQQEVLWKSWQARAQAAQNERPGPKKKYDEWTAPGRHRALLRRARIVLKVLKTEYLAAGWDNRRTYRALKENIEEIVYSLELSHLDRDVLEGQFATPLLLQNAAPEPEQDAHATRVAKVEAEAQRSHTTAWIVLGLSRTAYFLWKGQKPGLSTERKASTDLIVDNLR